MAEPVIRAVVVDDHPVFRLGLTALLGSLPGIEVVGEAATVAEAMAIVAAVDPDVVLMDVDLPDGSGLSATRLLVTAERRVVMLTMSEDDDTVAAALRAGARGYVVKGAPPNEIEQAVRAAASGAMVISQAVAGSLPGLLTARRASEPLPHLTDREREVLDLLARGVDTSGVARRLGCSDKTVRNHVSNILTKLQVTSRAQAVAVARDAGLGSLRDD